jgi:hypothetical protein
LSARIKFDLTASRRVQEQAGPEYQTLAEHTSYALAIFQNTARQNIARVIDLEIKVCKDEIAKEFCKGIFALAGAIAINHPQIDVKDTDNLINLVFEKSRSQATNEGPKAAAAAKGSSNDKNRHGRQKKTSRSNKNASNKSNSKSA